tara:strand:- start:385 stop:591 length:207 start_codon:yes stop_codon:yes gene_type:complete
MKKLVDGVVQDMTAEEIAQREQDDINNNAREEAIKQAIEDKANLKASAKAKLMAGEPLTEAEADTLVI